MELDLKKNVIFHNRTGYQTTNKLSMKYSVNKKNYAVVYLEDHNTEWLPLFWHLSEAAPLLFQWLTWGRHWINPYTERKIIIFFILSNKIKSRFSVGQKNRSFLLWELMRDANVTQQCWFIEIPNHGVGSLKKTDRSGWTTPVIFRDPGEVKPEDGTPCLCHILYIYLLPGFSVVSSPLVRGLTANGHWT